MKTYSPNDVLRIAKRQHNKKRAYLLVNPMQAKHMPVSPSKSLEMMMTLGAKLSQEYPNCKLVIGFAETATAIGAAVASCFSEDCIYIHTTREDVPDISQWILFEEEHSHATQQKLSGNFLADWIKKTDQIIFVDDEISTGKTLINMVEQLTAQFPALRQKQMIAASIINRLSAENETGLSLAGIGSEYLVKLDAENYDKIVEQIQPASATDLMGSNLPGASYDDICPVQRYLDPRKGLKIRCYKENCLQIARSAIPHFQRSITVGDKVLVLGTEECMFPALIMGRQIEDELGAEVCCHATTRSPIGIADGDSYPIKTGYKLHSFYNANRETYIYNLTQYDTVIVVTDSGQNINRPLSELCKAFEDFGGGKMFVVNGGPCSPFIAEVKALQRCKE